ncbi:YadA family autotransporter adhesin [Hydromonas duriensis]|uniref:YadA family autotransporter adhesin n=1 Tax=Hydromonas duriensis TaxID=1527608 RepID=UPI001FE6461E|nr:YadA-like family protein [Hydromonas duriensis]
MSLSTAHEEQSTSARDTVTTLSTTVTMLSTTFSTSDSTIASLSTTVSTIYEKGTKYFHANSTEADSVASGLNSVAIGPNSVASGTNSVAQGNGATASGTNSMALGTNANASSDNSVALGSNSVANGATLSNTAYNPGSGAIAGTTPVGEVSVGAAGAERRVTNVAAGSDDTDAVNVSQLRSMAGMINTNVDQKLNDLDNKMSARVAASLALEAAPYIPGKLTYYSGVGYSGGQTALGVSLRKTADNGRWSISGGVAGSDKGGVNARVGFAGVIGD